MSTDGFKISKWIIVPISFVVFALVALFAVIYIVQKNKSQIVEPPMKSLQANQDGTAEVRGLVVRNIHGCTVDALCYLLVDAGTSEVKVIYGRGESYSPGNPCRSEEVRQAGDAPAGSRVAALGKYSAEGGAYMLDPCGEDRYYLHVTSGF